VPDVPAVLIRAVQPGDGPGLARVWTDNGEYFAALSPAFRAPDPDGLAEWFERIHTEVGDDPGHLRLIALRGDLAVGLLGARLLAPMASAKYQLRHDFGGHRLHVDSLGVLTGHRRSGIGSALLGRAEEWGRARCARTAVLETNLGNPESEPFCERHRGYTRRAVEFHRPL
jgi:ribosomal protein S18 acetylase RimI-like enzyme